MSPIKDILGIYIKIIAMLITEVVDMGVAFLELALELFAPTLKWGRVNPVKFSLFWLLLPSIIGVPLIVLL